MVSMIRHGVFERYQHDRALYIQEDGRLALSGVRQHSQRICLSVSHLFYISCFGPLSISGRCQMYCHFGELSFGTRAQVPYCGRRCSGIFAMGVEEWENRVEYRYGQDRSRRFLEVCESSAVNVMTNTNTSKVGVISLQFLRSKPPNLHSRLHCPLHWFSSSLSFR